MTEMRLKKALPDEKRLSEKLDAKATVIEFLMDAGNQAQNYALIAAACEKAAVKHPTGTAAHIYAKQCARHYTTIANAFLKLAYMPMEVCGLGTQDQGEKPE